MIFDAIRGWLMVVRLAVLVIRKRGMSARGRFSAVWRGFECNSESKNSQNELKHPFTKTQAHPPKTSKTFTNTPNKVFEWF